MRSRYKPGRTSLDEAITAADPALSSLLFPLSSLAPSHMYVCAGSARHAWGMFCSSYHHCRVCSANSLLFLRFLCRQGWPKLRVLHAVKAVRGGGLAAYPTGPSGCSTSAMGGIRKACNRLSVRSGTVAVTSQVVVAVVVHMHRRGCSCAGTSACGCGCGCGRIRIHIHVSHVHTACDCGVDMRVILGT